MWEVFVLTLSILISKEPFHGIYFVKDFQIPPTIFANVVLDSKGDAHLLLSTLASVRSYNLDGKMEWIMPGMRFFSVFERPEMSGTDYALVSKSVSDTEIIIYSINLRKGSIKDSLKLHGKGITAFIGAFTGPFYVVISRENSPFDNPYIHFLKLDEKGRIKVHSVLHGGFFRTLSYLWKDDIALIGMWAPLNYENPSRAGISDINVGIAMVSLSSGLVINRFMMPYEGFSRSYVLHYPGENYFIAAYRGNYRNLEQFSGFYKISLPTMRKIKQIELKGNIYPSPELLNGRIIAGVDERNKVVYFIDGDSFNVMCKINLQRYLIPKLEKRYPISKIRGVSYIANLDVNKDGYDDLVIYYLQIYGCLDPVWAQIYDKHGVRLLNRFIFVIPGPDYRKVYPIYLSVREDISLVSFIPDKNLFIAISQKNNKVLIYKLF